MQTHECIYSNMHTSEQCKRAFEKLCRGKKGALVRLRPYPGVEAIWSDVRFKWSKSWPQYLQWPSVNWVLLVRVELNITEHFTMEVNQVALYREREGGEREK